MKALKMLALAAICGGGSAMASAAETERRIVALDGPGLPESLVRHNVEAQLVKAGPDRGLKVRFQVTDWPNVFFQPGSGSWDWSGFAGIAVDVYNPEAEAQGVEMRVDNPG